LANLARNTRRDRGLTFNRHYEPTGRREAPPDDRLREAIHSFLCAASWIASLRSQ
jgi:hypothetical protein